MLLTATILISTSVYAGGGMGGGQSMMGGQGHMMGSSPGFLRPGTGRPQRFPAYQYNEQRDRERLRAEIREKRQELSELFRSDKPDKMLIDQKMAELNALETEYDRSDFRR